MTLSAPASTLIPPRAINHTAAYSLFELMISLSIVIIFLLIAAPSFSSMLDRNATRTATQQLTQALKLARNEALNSQLTVHVCAINTDFKAPSNSCKDPRQRNVSWADGVIVFSDINRNNELDPMDRLIKVLEFAGRTEILFNQRGRLRFFNDGSARSAGFYLCSAEQKHSRHIKLLHTGRLRSAVLKNKTFRRKCPQEKST